MHAASRTGRDVLRRPAMVHMHKHMCMLEATSNLIAVNTPICTAVLMMCLCVMLFFGGGAVEQLSACVHGSTAEDDAPLDAVLEGLLKELLVRVQRVSPLRPCLALNLLAQCLCGSIQPRFVHSSSSMVVASTLKRLLMFYFAAMFFVGAPSLLCSTDQQCEAKVRLFILRRIFFCESQVVL